VGVLPGAQRGIRDSRSRTGSRRPILIAGYRTRESCRLRPMSLILILMESSQQLRRYL
jgi:hypothetical protein